MKDYDKEGKVISEKDQLEIERKIYKKHLKENTLGKYYLEIINSNEEKRKRAKLEIKKLMRDIPPKNDKDINKIVRIVSVRCDLPYVYVSKLLPKRRKVK